MVGDFEAIDFSDSRHHYQIMNTGKGIPPFSIILVYLSKLIT
jgi:hypothetical protein